MRKESQALTNADICTNFANLEDKDILTRPLFAVNMRLFRTSPGYKALVLAACAYLVECCGHEQGGKDSYIGYSGANAGIPWDIIAVRRGGGVDVMINARLRPNGNPPKVLSYEGCGSLPALGPMYVERDAQIEVEYFDLGGEFRLEFKVSQDQGGFVIQHEVDHNDGILLTDRKVGP
jgi:hypothetical protein